MTLPLSVNWGVPVDRGAPGSCSGSLMGRSYRKASVSIYFIFFTRFQNEWAPPRGNQQGCVCGRPRERAADAHLLHLFAGEASSPPVAASPHRLPGVCGTGQVVCDHFFPLRHARSPCSIVVLSIFCPKPELNQISKEPWSPIVENGIYRLSPGPGGAHCILPDVRAAPRSGCS